MRGKTNTYNYFFSNIIDPNASDLAQSDIVTSNGLTYQFYNDGNGQWELAILTSGTINFKKSIDVDVWMVGGGKNGADGSFSGSPICSGQGGNGGNGGECIYQQTSITKNTNYSIVIGNNNNNTSGFNITAQSGGGCAGGSGGSVSAGDQSKSGATKGVSSVLYAFHNENSSYFYPHILFGAGGGGGRASGYNPYLSNQEYNILDTHLPYYTSEPYGGNTGGGNGGDYGYDDWIAGNGTAGHANYGAGGGGGAGCGTGGYGTKGTGGAGGTGIIIIHPKNFKYWTTNPAMIYGNKNWGSSTGGWGLRTYTIGDGWHSLDYCEIIGNNLVIGTEYRNNYANVALYGTNNAINLTNYSSIKIKVKSHENGSPYNQQTTQGDQYNVKLGISSTANSSGTWNPTGDGSTSPPGMEKGVVLNGPGIFSLDISTITGAKYIWIYSASHSQVLTTIQQIWLE